jgi:hypothetical protein
VITTAHPRATIRSAMPRPIPLAPPVTTQLSMAAESTRQNPDREFRGEAWSERRAIGPAVTRGIHMRDTLKNRVLPVLAGAALVVGGLNVASYAANGHPLNLGGKNAEKRTTTLTNQGKGPALSLKSGKKAPSLAVSNSKLVKHLNADEVDGQSAAALQTQGTTWTIPAGATLSYTLNGVPAGTYLASVNVLLAATGPSECELDENGVASAVTYGTNRSSAFSAVSGTGVVTHVAGRALTLSCGDATGVLAGNFASTVTLVRLDQAAKGTVTVAPPARTHLAHAPTGH